MIKTMGQNPGLSIDERRHRSQVRLSSNTKLCNQLREQALAFLGPSLFRRLSTSYDSQALALTAHFFVRAGGDDHVFDDTKSEDVAIVQELHIIALSAMLQAHCPSWREAQESRLGSLAYQAAQSCMAAAHTVQEWAKKMTLLRSTAAQAKLSQHRAFLEEKFNLMFIPSLATSIRAKYPALISPPAPSKEQA